MLPARVYEIHFFTSCRGGYLTLATLAALSCSDKLTHISLHWVNLLADATLPVL